MIAVWQRVAEASVTVDGKTVSSIGPGALLLVGVENGDTEKDALFIADKAVHIRAFGDDQGRLNRSVIDTGGKLLVVSQFTLCGDCRKGRRPSFIRAARPEDGKLLYETVCRKIAEYGVEVQKGIFQADMKVRLVNDGPVTLIFNSKA